MDAKTKLSLTTWIVATSMILGVFTAAVSPLASASVVSGDPEVKPLKANVGDTIPTITVTNLTDGHTIQIREGSSATVIATTLVSGGKAIYTNVAVNALPADFATSTLCPTGCGTWDFFDVNANALVKNQTSFGSYGYVACATPPATAQCTPVVILIYPASLTVTASAGTSYRNDRVLDITGTVKYANGTLATTASAVTNNACTDSGKTCLHVDLIIPNGTSPTYQNTAFVETKTGTFTFSSVPVGALGAGPYHINAKVVVVGSSGSPQASGTTLVSITPGAAALSLNANEAAPVFNFNGASTPWNRVYLWLNRSEDSNPIKLANTGSQAGCSAINGAGAFTGATSASQCWLNMTIVTPHATLVANGTFPTFNANGAGTFSPTNAKYIVGQNQTYANTYWPFIITIQDPSMVQTNGAVGASGSWASGKFNEIIIDTCDLVWGGDASTAVTGSTCANVVNGAGSVIQKGLLGSGTYTVSAMANTKGSKAAEYTAPAFAFTVSVAAKANFQLTWDTTTRTVPPPSNGVPAPSTTSTATGPGAPGTRTISFQIYGSGSSDKPTASDNAFVNLSGDVLSTTVGGTNLVTAGTQKTTGLNAVISGGSGTITFTPTRGLGTVTATANWRGISQTFTFTTTNASIAVSASPTTNVISATGKVTAHVTDAFGTPEPNAVVVLFWLTAPTPDSSAGAASPYSGTLQGTEIARIDGAASHGDVGKGQNGDYVFNVPTDRIGTVGVLARDVNFTGAFRWAYSSFKVVRGNDVAVTVNVTKATTGVKMEFAANATVGGKQFTSQGDSNGVGDSNTFVALVHDSAYTTFAKAYTTDPTSVLGNATNAGCLTDGTAPAGIVCLTEDTTAGKHGNWKVTTELKRGLWHVFARSGAHDNFGKEPIINVSDAMVVFSPTRVPAAFQPDQKVTISVTDVNGKPLDGTLTLKAAAQFPAKPGETVDCTISPATSSCVAGGNAAFWGHTPTGNVTSTNNLTILTPPAGSACLSLTTQVCAKGTVTIDIVNGHAVSMVTGLTPGAINVSFLHSRSGGPSDTIASTTGALLIIGPTVTVSPTTVPLGQSASILVTVKDLQGNPLKDLWVQLQGSPVSNFCTDQVKTDTSGTARLGFFAGTAGTVTVFLTSTTPSSVSTCLGSSSKAVDANGNPVTIKVFGGLQLNIAPANPVEGSDISFIVTQIAQGNPPVVGARVIVKTVPGSAVKVNSTTDSTGTVTAQLANGNYTATASDGVNVPVTRNFTVGPKPPTPPAAKAHFTLTNPQVTPSSADLGAGFTASVSVKNDGNADDTAHIRLKVNGAIIDTKDLFLAAGDSASVSFTFTPTQAGTFQVTMGVSGGNDTAAKTITVNKVTSTTPTGSTPPSSSTPSGGSTPPSSSTVSSTGPTGVPGFEAVFALAAIGLAVLVVRRRRS